jgi:hypothetical protein
MVISTEVLPDGSIKEIYETLFEFDLRRNQLDRTGGRRQTTYEGWLNGRLVRILR